MKNPRVLFVGRTRYRLPLDPALENWLRALPKAEMHLHFEGAFRWSTIRELHPWGPSLPGLISQGPGVRAPISFDANLPGARRRYPFRRASASSSSTSTRRSTPVDFQ